ncbi:helix-turn-helix transcriptional regulator [Microbispora sp. RL4-1S]|uniref:Helix-turn-helix transcriptional regulator n=1 Tax=Microbispora oryzae TaxID=2806554 RepID=A0A941AMP9_9ACTN|nr:helix-turn-helix transcriptional regulator [Microbispora oryzae]
MAAALELFSRRDAEDVSIDDVAASAGASRALVYHYFGGKQELYVAALRSAADGLQDRLQRQERGGGSLEVARGLSRYFDFVEEHAAGFAALLRGGPGTRTGEIGEIVDGVRQRMFRLVLSEMGIAEPGPVLRTTLRSWIACVETAGLDWLDNRDMKRTDLEGLLMAQMVALLQVAATHDLQVKQLLEASPTGR